MRQFSKINNELCLSVHAVALTMGIVLDKALNTIKQGLKRYRNGRTLEWRHYSDDMDNRVKWLVYDALPVVSRLRVDHHYGDVEKHYYLSELKLAANTYVDTDDVGYYRALKARKGDGGFTEDQAMGMATGCGWLRMLEAGVLKELFGNRKLLYHKWAAKAIHEQQLYGLKLRSGRVLDRRVKLWVEIGRDSLLSKKFHNNNSQKVTDLGMKRLLDLYGSPQKPSFELTTKIYNEEARQGDWKALSTERVRQLLSLPKYKSIWRMLRDGKTVFANTLEGTIKRRKASFPDSLWSFDGMTVQLYYQNEKGELKSDLYAILVMDVCSDMVLGWAIGFRENGKLVQCALRDAVKYDMMRPVQLQYDNSSANKSKEVGSLMSKMARMYWPSAPYNGKAKPVENLIGRLERLIMRHYKNFKGGNITSPSLSIKMNPDYVAQLKKNGDLPNQEGVIQQIHKVFHLHNHKKGKDGFTPIERYKQMQHPERKKVSYLEWVDLFWVERRQECRYTKDGLTMEVNKERHTYEVESTRGVEDLDFRVKYLGDRFSIKYNPEVLEYINLYQGGAHVATARKKYEFAMARIDMQEGEGKVLHQRLLDRDKYNNRAFEAMGEVEETVRESGYGAFDHRLAHKDEYNRMAREQEDEVLERLGILPTVVSKKEVKILYNVGEGTGEVIR